ncbi:MAG: SycD/LcrH family type III secretion system chaperone [Deltaproteobacteria bacterium]|jgi:type III secretion system low calcium response chaperone LcrH/SycD|nr:SycD/LcrH family type III secretion system chaperone [Deltaproteobacteria bacterium]
MIETGQPTPLDLTEDDINFMLSAISDGVSPAAVAGLDQDNLEALYALGHRLYSSGQYKDAETAFRALCLYDYHDTRFWMGLGASLQAQEKLAMAAEVYAMAGLSTSLSDPSPFYYAALCQLKLGQFDSADATLEAIESMGTPGNSQDESFQKKAANLRSVIKEKLSVPQQDQSDSK